MAKKKTTTWYAIRTPREDLKIEEVQVIKEEGERLLLDIEMGSSRWRPGMAWFYKDTSYEKIFKTREEAVKAKHGLLEEEMTTAVESAAQATRCLRDFEKQEKL